MTLLKKFKKLDKYTKLAIIIIIIGIIVRFGLASVYHVSGDACWHNSVARFIANEGKIPLFEKFGREEPFWPPPLFHLILALVYKIFGIYGENTAEFSAKMVSPLFGSLTLIFSYLIMKRLFKKRIALYSLLFLTFVPLSIDHGILSYIESTLVFFVVLSVYFMLKNKIVSSAICLGLAILTKYNGIFILPLLIYLIYSNKKNFFKNTLILISISSLIGLPWFIRNWIYLGNPVWPFFNTIFHGIQVKSFVMVKVGAISIMNIFDINGLMSIYLGMFGVPDGNYNTLFFFKIPAIKLLFAIWFLATITFILPLLLGLFSKTLKHKKILFIWVGSYIVMILLYVINSSWSVARYILPAFPALALIWGTGLSSIKSKKITKIFTIILILIITGFVFTGFFKITIAAKSWNLYNQDFEWVKSNTEKGAVFLSYQCLSYNLNRFSMPFYSENVKDASYIFVNKNFKLEPRSIATEDILNIIDEEKFEKVYNNPATNTIIYKTK